MYSWGGGTKDWKKPGAYKFDSARAPYLDALAKDASKRGPRTYTMRDEPDMKLVDPNGKEISSKSKNPLLFGIDVTGSMVSWPAEIFDRLPLIYQTLSQYRDDLEISFSAIGDANTDRFPLQINRFGKGLDLEEHIKALCPEGGGGGQISESYELFAYFMLEHCKTENAVSPSIIIYLTYKFYNKIDPAQVAHYIGDKLQTELDSGSVWKKLMQRFDIYFLHKPYGEGNSPSTDKEVIKHWADSLGRERIIELPSAERAVDVAIGLIAKKWGHYADFKENLSARQEDDSVKDSVYASLRIIGKDMSTKSVVDTSSKKKTKPLSELPDDKK